LFCSILTNADFVSILAGVRYVSGPKVDTRLTRIQATRIQAMWASLLAGTTLVVKVRFSRVNYILCKQSLGWRYI